MADPTDLPREYLRQALKERGIEMKAASFLIGRAHSYIRDYLVRRTPAYLDEADRELLVKEYGLSSERLRPPSKSVINPSPSSEGSLDIDPEVVRNLLNAPENRKFLGLWIGMDEATRDTALEILDSVSRLSRLKSAS